MSTKKNWSDFCRECQHNNLHIAQELYFEKQFTQKLLCSNNNELINYVCCNDVYDIAQWLVTIIDYNNDKNAIIDVLYNSINKSCTKKLTQTEILLIDTYKIKNNDLIKIIAKICTKNSLEKIVSLHEKYNFTRDEFLNNDNECFVQACVNGQCNIAKWLNIQCLFTKDEILINNCVAFNQTHKNKHIKITKWMKDAWDITSVDIAKHFGNMFD